MNIYEKIDLIKQFRNFSPFNWTEDENTYSFLFKEINKKYQYLIPQECIKHYFLNSLYIFSDYYKNKKIYSSEKKIAISLSKNKINSEVLTFEEFLKQYIFKIFYDIFVYTKNIEKTGFPFYYDEKTFLKLLQNKNFQLTQENKNLFLNYYNNYLIVILKSNITKNLKKQETNLYYEDIFYRKEKNSLGDYLFYTNYFNVENKEFITDHEKEIYLKNLLWEFEKIIFTNAESSEFDKKLEIIFNKILKKILDGISDNLNFQYIFLPYNTDEHVITYTMPKKLGKKNIIENYDFLNIYLNNTIFFMHKSKKNDSFYEFCIHFKHDVVIDK